MKNKIFPKKPPGIPHLQLFGKLSELKNYKVRNVLAHKLILAENIETEELVIFKTLHKSAAIFKKTKTSLLPINISYMVRLLKYFETDDCVYLMLGEDVNVSLAILKIVSKACKCFFLLSSINRITFPPSCSEHCSAGLLWDVAKPLIGQKQRKSLLSVGSAGDQCQMVYDTNKSPARRQTSIIKPSESFIHDRKISINLNSDDAKPICDVNESDNDEEDMMIVHKTGQSSVVVVNANKIEHFENINPASEQDESSSPQLECDSNIVKSSQSMINQISAKLDKNDAGVKNVLDKLDHIETKIKRHLDGNLSPSSAPSPRVSPSPPPTSATSRVSPPPPRPPVLRTLSSLLPQCPLSPQSGDMTELPDKLIRSWAAQLAAVLSSLHYREVQRPYSYQHIFIWFYLLTRRSSSATCSPPTCCWTSWAGSS